MTTEPGSARPARGLSVLPWVMWAGTLVLLLVGGYFLAVTADVPRAIDWGFRGYPAVLSLPFATVGTLLASRRPENPIGWLFCLVGLISGAQLLVEEYGVYATLQPGAERAGRIADWIGHWIWVPGAGVLAGVLLVFPTGTFLSPRWKHVRTLAVAGTLIAITGFGLGSPRDLGMSGRNPYAAESFGSLTPILTMVGLGLLLPSLVLAAVAVVVRMRRTRGEQRQQMKWLVFAAALIPIGNLIATLPAPQLIRNAGVCALSVFPIAVGIAVLKYRLYEIDVVINRALVYGTSTTIVVLMYVTLVVLLQGALDNITEGSGIAVAASTLMAAALFNPLRIRVQRFVDRRFYRSKYDAVSTLGSFSARLRDEVDLDSLVTELRDVVSETMHPQHVTVWLRSDQSRTATPEKG